MLVVPLAPKLNSKSTKEHCLSIFQTLLAIFDCALWYWIPIGEGVAVGVMFKGIHTSRGQKHLRYWRRCITAQELSAQSNDRSFSIGIDRQDRGCILEPSPAFD